MSIGEVLEAVQGDGDPIKCAVNGKECPKKDDCAVRDLVLEGRRQMFAYYNRRTLQDLAERY